MERVSNSGVEYKLPGWFEGSTKNYRVGNYLYERTLVGASVAELGSFFSVALTPYDIFLRSIRTDFYVFAASGASVSPGCAEIYWNIAPPQFSTIQGAVNAPNCAPNNLIVTAGRWDIYKHEKEVMLNIPAGSTIAVGFNIQGTFAAGDTIRIYHSFVYL